MGADPRSGAGPSQVPSVLLCGPPGAGKSTVARLVAEHFPVSAHLKVDDLREIMVNGFAPPGEWTDAAEQQFRRARLAATEMARLHADDDVTLVIDDVCVPAHFEDHYRSLFAGLGVHRVMLKPTMTALRDRVQARGGPWDEVFLSSGALEWCYEGLETLPLEGWTVVDSSDQSVDQTVAEVVRVMTGSD